MSFSWEPFGRIRQDDPQPAAPESPAPPPAPTREPVRPAALPSRPARGLAVLTCMDCRIDPLSALGLSLGDAVVLRNAGATVSDDVLRSIQLAHDALGVNAVHVIGHTDCAAHGRDDEAAAAEAEYGAERISAVLPNLRVSSGLLDLATGQVL
jgi:carbonic anhydrase